MTYAKLTEPEPVDVLVKFMKEGMSPISFRWGKYHYPIERIGLRYEERVGRDKHVFFTAVSGGETYKLMYSLERLKWLLHPPERML